MAASEASRPTIGSVGRLSLDHGAGPVVLVARPYAGQRTGRERVRDGGPDLPSFCPRALPWIKRRHAGSGALSLWVQLCVTTSKRSKGSKPGSGPRSTRPAPAGVGFGRPAAVAAVEGMATAGSLVECCEPTGSRLSW